MCNSWVKLLDINWLNALRQIWVNFPQHWAISWPTINCPTNLPNLLRVYEYNDINNSNGNNMILKNISSHFHNSLSGNISILIVLEVKITPLYYTHNVPYIHKYKNHKNTQHTQIIYQAWYNLIACNALSSNSLMNFSSTESENVS